MYKLTMWMCVLLMSMMSKRKIGKVSKMDSKINDKPGYRSQIKLKDLKSLIKAKKPVLVLYHKGDKESVQLTKVLMDASKLLSDTNLVISQYSVFRIDKFIINRSGAQVRNDFYFYLSGISKHYDRNFTASSLAKWVRSMLDAKPVTISSLADVHDMDRHYFLYMDGAIFAKNQEKSLLISQLIYPVPLFVSSNTANILSELNHNEKAMFFTHRETGRDLHLLDIRDTAEGISSFVVPNEFPPYLLCNDYNLRLIKHFRLPLAIYFGKHMNEAGWLQLLASSEHFALLIEPVFVENGSKDECSKFLREQAGHGSSRLVVLSFHPKLTRLHYTGAFTSKELEQFLYHFSSGDLRHVPRNREPFNEDDGVMEVYKGVSHRGLKAELRDPRHTVVALVYVPGDQGVGVFMESVSKLIEKLEVPGPISKLKLDYSTNDVDRRLHSHFPFLLIKVRGLRMSTFHLTADNWEEQVEKAIIKNKEELENIANNTLSDL